jgi:hypothetical protein
MTDDEFRNRPLSEEEITAFEVSEDRRLREMGIDPDGDPIEIMMEVRRQARKQKGLDHIPGKPS